MPGRPLPFVTNGDHIQENKTKYKWVTHGTNCPVCNILRGRVYALIVWYDTVTPGFHPCCDCELVPVSDDIPESSLQIFGVVPWIDRLSFNTYTRWWIKRLMPWDIQEVGALTEAYQETGNWAEAFKKVKQDINPRSTVIDPRIAIFNTQHPLTPLISWFDGVFTTRIQTAPTPSADLPWETP